MRHRRLVPDCGLAARVALLLLAATPAVHADHFPRWELGASLAGLHLPDYRGSDQGRSYLAPFPYLIYRGDKVSVSEEGVRGLIYESGSVALDLSLAAAIPVNSDDNDARNNMPDLDPTLEAGPSLKIRFGEQTEKLSYWELNLPLRAVVATDLRHTESIGWTFSPHIDYVKRFPFPGGRLRMTLSFGPIWATDEYHDYYYGVEPQFATPQRPTYRAGGGYSGTRFMATFGKRLNSRMMLGGFVHYDNLNNAAFESSPLVRRGDAWMAGLALTWIFTKSDEIVDHER